MYKRYQTAGFSFLCHPAFIRRIASHHGVELVRGIYPAVRDRNWGTVPVEILNQHVENKDGSFQLRTELLFRDSQAEFKGIFEVEISREGNIEVLFEGRALRTFLKNRIGLNLLLPVTELTECSCQVISQNVKISETHFPSAISPVQPFKNISGLEWTDRMGNRLKLRFEGDIFEMEDQRNWGDFSYKIYSGPLEIPYPSLINEGDFLRQKISISTEIQDPSETVVSSSKLSDINPVKRFSLPDIGLGENREGGSRGPGEIHLLSELRPDFYGIFCIPGRKGWKEKADLQLEDCIKAGSGAKISLILPPGFSEEKEMIGFLKQHEKHIRSVDVFSSENFLSIGKEAESLLLGIKKNNLKFRTGGGSYAYYAELNRSERKAFLIDYISFSACPQVHAFDDLTLIENIRGIASTVSDAVKKYQMDIDINALSLRQRMNFVSTENDSGNKDIFLKDMDDRQSTNFTAIWTLGLVTELMFSGLKSLCIFETSGPHGIMTGEGLHSGSASQNEELPQPYPVYFMLKELLRHKNSDFSTLPFSTDFDTGGFQVSNAGIKHLWLWNYSSQIRKPSCLKYLSDVPARQFNPVNGIWKKPEKVENLLPKSIYSFRVMP